MSNTEIDPGKRYPYGNNENFAPKTTLDGLTYGVNEKLSKDAAVSSVQPGPSPEPVDSPLAMMFFISAAEDDRTGMPQERASFELYAYYDEIDTAIQALPGVDTAQTKTMSDSNGGGVKFAVILELTGTSIPQSASSVFNAIKDIQPHDGDTGPVVNHVAAITEFRVPNK